MRTSAVAITFTFLIGILAFSVPPTMIPQIDLVPMGYALVSISAIGLVVATLRFGETRLKTAIVR